MAKRIALGNILETPGQILKKENWLGGRQFGEQLRYFGTKDDDKGESVLNVYGFDNVEGDRICNIYERTNVYQPLW
jgi:hypothetical protein